MYQLSDKDGTAAHRRALRHHIRKCQAVQTPLHAQLVVEAEGLYDQLKARARAHEDRVDDTAGADADADRSEIAFEDAIRNLDADLAKLDRADPSLGARAAIFPDGFGPVIDPEVEAQLDVLPALHIRITPFQGHAALADSLAKLDATEVDLKQAIAAAQAAEAIDGAAFAEELQARRAVREQFTSAHGRLRDFYKAQPRKADQFFLRVSGRRVKKVSGGGGGVGGAGGSGAPGGGTP